MTVYRVTQLEFAMPMNPTARRVLFGVLASAWSLIILAACLLPSSNVPKSAIPGYHIPHQDKVVHVMIFAVFGFLWIPALRTSARELIVVLAGVLYGGVTEIIQHLAANGRTASLVDMAANAVGVLIGVAAYRVSVRPNARRAPRGEVVTPTGPWGGAAGPGA